MEVWSRRLGFAMEIANLQLLISNLKMFATDTMVL